MRGWFTVLFLFSSGGCVTTPDVNPEDTRLEGPKRDWVEVFVHEINEAGKHKDQEAYYFFMQELVKEHYRRTEGVEIDPNPLLEFPP